MAKLSNINNLFSVDSTGAIEFSTQVGTTGYVLESRGAGNAPVWTDRDTGRITGSGAANRVTYWTGTYSISSDAGFTYNGAGRVNTDESFGVSKDGADTVADGPFFRLTNAAQDRQYLNQLDASNNIDYWYYNGTAWTQTISLLTSGGATFGGDVTINGKTTFNIDVDSKFTIEDAGTNAVYMRAGASDEVYFGANNNYQLRLKTNKDVVMDNGGNLAIGTGSPNPFGWGDKHLTVLAAGTNQYAAVDIVGSGNAAGAILFGGGSGSGTANDIARAQISGLDGSHLVFSTNASNSGSSFTERMRITSGGNVQVGTTPGITPAILSARKNGSCIEFGHTNNTGRYEGTLGSFGSNGSSYIGFSTECENSVNTFTTRGAKGNIINGDTDGNLKFLQVTNATATGQTPVERMRITSDGKIQAQTAGGYYLTESTTNAFSITSNGANGYFKIRDEYNSSDRFYIKHTGEIGIGNTNPLRPLDITADSGAVCLNLRARSANDYAYIQWSNHDRSVYLGETYVAASGGAASSMNWNVGTTHRMSLNNSGTLTVTGDIVAYGSPSDKRLKENIKPIESALDKAMKLQGVTFDWKKSESILDIKEDIGFIAQDVQKIIPELVRENKDGMLSMRHQGIAPILLEAIKELKAEIEELKSNKCNCNK